MRLHHPTLLWLLVAPGLAGAGEFDCVTEPRQVVEVRSAVDGLIERITVDRGDLVVPGQVLVNLDASLEKASAELAQYKATMSGAIHSGENRLDFARIKADRRERLSSEHFVTPQDRDEAVGERQLAESQLQESRENQRLAELEARRTEEQLQLRTVRSPIGGVVIERLMNPGELSDNRDPKRPILKIADISLLYVEALLPLEALGRVHPGMPAVVSPEGPVGGHFPARVKVVDRVLDAASGTFGVRLELPNPRLEVPAGVKCRVSFKDMTLDRPHAAESRPGAGLPAVPPVPAAGVGPGR